MSFLRNISLAATTTCPWLVDALGAQVECGQPITGYADTRIGEERRYTLAAACDTHKDDAVTVFATGILGLPTGEEIALRNSEAAR